MVDPNRTINLPSSSENSEEEELDANQVSLIKDLEEKFKNRFTENDQEFMEVCKRKNKDPPILELNYQGHRRPHNNYRGGYSGHRGGGYQNNRGGYHNRGGYNNNYNKRKYDDYNQNQRRDDYGDSSRRPRFNN